MLKKCLYNSFLNPFKISLILFCALLVISWVSYRTYLRWPVVKEAPFHYILKPGETTHDLANDLYQAKLIPSPLIFRAIARLRRVDQQMRAGEYYFPIGSSLKEIFQTIEQGKIVYYDFTIVNGWNIYQVLARLNQAPNLKHTLQLDSLNSIAAALHITQSTPEGWLYPETYHYKRGDTDLSLLQQAHQLMQSKLSAAWQKRAKGLFYHTPYQALIVASMVEKESSLDAEKPIIVDIILKRVKIWMPLQIDAAVIYGLGPSFNGDLTKADLRRKTPYNTYLHYGLPPTPIAMPGQSSIDAALHPLNSEMLYYVAKGDGTHVFSKTFKEQQRQIARYIKRRK